MTEGIPGIDVGFRPVDEGLACHILDLPPDATASDVFDLVNQLYPEVPAAALLEDAGSVRISALTTLYGLDQNPAGGTSWCFVTPHQRGEAPSPGAADPDGLYFAFSEGLPEHEELRITLLMLSLARRLDGVVTFDAQLEPAGAQIEPDPNIRIDLVVWSHIALRADELLAVVREVEPDAELPEEDRSLPAPTIFDADEYPARHAASMERVQRQPPTDGGVTVVVPLEDTESPDFLVDDTELDGLIVALAPSDGSLPPPGGVPSHREQFCYAIRWLPLEESQLMTDLPEPGFVESREFARYRLRLVALAVADAVDGIVVDADGFLLDRSELDPLRRD